MPTNSPHAAYVHIPFCVSKCSYCDFNSFPAMDSIFEDYARALIEEIEHVRLGIVDPLALETAYFGGGTPTLLSSQLIASTISALARAFGLASECEVTIEANPGTVDEYKFAQLLACGVNRLSIGVQSLDDAFLRKLGRVHSVEEALEAYAAARRAGFGNVGIDLMFALPGQCLSHWAATLDTAVSLAPEHISLYELSIEEGTRFAALCLQGDLDLPEEDDQLDMYELAIATLTSAGYEHYEVSNFARPGFRSRHNQVYWRNEPYYGFGAGATSYVDGARSRRVGDPRAYIRAIRDCSDATEFSESLTGQRFLAETIIQGLRMLDGIDISKITARTGTDPSVVFASQIKSLRERGFVEQTDARLRVTHQGLLIMNDVAQEFL